MANEIGIGVIGTGFARKVQIPGFKACDGARIVSVASGSIENARSTASEFDIDHFTDDWRETVTNPDVDLVCITTPPNLHRDMTLAACENGKHILCEKPMAMNVAEAEEMSDAAKNAGVLALIDHELRFLPGRQKAYEMLRDGAIGKVRHAKYNFRAAYRGDPERLWNWWSDADQGGGALGAIDSHIVDSFLWFLGTEISSIFCQLNTHVRERSDRDGRTRPVTADDEANLLLRFADSDLTENATALVDCSMSEPPEYKNVIEFFGTGGSMRVDNLGELYIGKSGETAWKRVDVDEPSAGSPGDNGFARGFRYIAPRIVDALRSDKRIVEGAATFDDGVRVQRVLDAAQESNRTRKAVDIV
jgi:predicted dehydrogenase